MSLTGASMSAIACAEALCATAADTQNSTAIIQHKEMLSEACHSSS